MKRVTENYLEQISRVENKIMIFSEMHANSEDPEEKKNLKERIENLKNDMLNKTRWLLSPTTNNIFEDQILFKVKYGFEVKQEDRTIKDITDGSTI